MDASEWEQSLPQSRGRSMNKQDDIVRAGCGGCAGGHRMGGAYPKARHMDTAGDVNAARIKERIYGKRADEGGIRLMKQNNVL